MSNKPWTKERVELLKRLAEEGLSSTAISERFGNLFSRNAVIGKIHRLKLVHNSSRSTVRSTKGVSAVRTSKAPVQPKTTFRVPYRPPQPPSAALVRDPNGLPFCEIYVTPEKRKGIIDLEPNDCRWPIGDPLHPTFHFCGREKAEGLSYCGHHAQVAYVPPDPNRKIRAPRESGSVKRPDNDNLNDNPNNFANADAAEKEMA